MILRDIFIAYLSYMMSDKDSFHGCDSTASYVSVRIVFRWFASCNRFQFAACWYALLCFVVNRV